MADNTDLQQLWRGIFDAGVDYWRAVGRLSANYVRAVSGVAGNTPTPAPVVDSAPGAATVSRRPVNATMVLEGKAGSTAVGMFLVENSGRDRIAGELAVPSLANADGREIRTVVSFDPAHVALEPGEQTVVQASATIGRSLKTDLDYRGEVHVPGLAGTTIPIVVRRLPAKAG